MVNQKVKETKNLTKRIMVLRCPYCLSHRVDLWLGGMGGLAMRKCLDCAYIGHLINFMVPEVKENSPPKKDAEKETKKEKILTKGV